MQAPNLVQDENDMMIPQNTHRTFEKAPNEHHKPFLASMIHKTVPIGQEFHQVQVPDYQPTLTPITRNVLALPSSPSVYLRSRVELQELEEYLHFVENYYEEKIPDYFTQGIYSRDRVRVRAMDFLHEMKYNYTRAKFYILFPYYLAYNQFRCHNPLNLTDPEMEHRIADHLQGLKSTKQKQLQRWIGTVQNSIESRIHLSKLNTLIQVAKQNKFQIPEAIREHVQRSIRTGRQIKKTFHSTRLTIDKLIAKKESLQEYKIITNEMIQFEQTVIRCQDWLKKQKRFQEFFFSEHLELRSKDLAEKIEFKTLQMLVNQFNNLPLIYQNFQRTTGNLYNQTLSLLEKLPPLNKTAKTRTAQNSTVSSKVNIEFVRSFLREIQASPVEHEEFINFEMSIRQNLQWLERIGVWLQDQKSQKSLKILNQYAKIINDIPISNKIQQKLQSRLEYYEIMQKVKKDISNPAKYEQIKDAIKKLKEKGYETCEYAKLETRIISYMGWYESQQILNQDRVPTTKLQLLTQRKPIKQRMIPEEAFKMQLLSARQELNIPEEVWIESEGKVKTVQALKLTINDLLNLNSPTLDEIIETIRQCIKNGLLFEEFQVLYNRLIEVYFLVAKMEFMLMTAQEFPPEGQAYLFNSEDLEYVFGALNETKAFEIKDLQVKEAGDEVLNDARSKGFPKHLISYCMFEDYMGRAETWSIKAKELIQAFKEQKGQISIRQLIDQSKNCLHSKVIEDELSKIDIILKWRQKINRKLSQNKENPFDNSDKIFLQQLQKDLQTVQQSFQCGDRLKQKSLEYLCRNAIRLNELLQKISGIQIECTYKLSQMNKFCKEIDRQIEKYKLNDKIIFDLKEELQYQLQLSDQWKEKYLAIKRFEKKKIKKDDDEEFKNVQVEILEEKISKFPENNADGVLFMPYVPALTGTFAVAEGKKKYFIKNGEFCWYYKLLLMIFQFCNGFNLKFAIEELVRLKSLLSDIHKFIIHYNNVMEKTDKTDQDLIALQAQGSKFPIFLRETYILSKKNSYISAWKEIAESVIKSVPVLSMQLKARKPEELLELLQMKKNQKDEGRDEGRCEQLGNKRKRKQNPFYSNEDMTLITEETFGIKAKKKRKGLNPDSQYRNTAVASTAKKLARNQKEEVERAEAILSGQVPPELIHIDDPKEYCICRYGVPNENSFMVQCEYKCQEWFHIECLGIKKHQTKNEMKLKCVGCKALYKEQTVGFFFWDSHAKLTQYALIQLVQQGKFLGVETNQMKKLQILFSKIQSWKASVKDMLLKVCETNGQDLPALEPPLYELFLQSLWIPCVHTETAILRKLVLMARSQC